MKIIHFHPDGRMAAQFIAPLISAEHGAGHLSELVLSRRPLHSDCVVIPYDILGLNLLRLPIALLKVYGLLRSRRPNIVVSHNTKSSLLPLVAAWCVGVRTRVYFNHGVPYVGYKGVLRWLLRGLERINCSLATHVVTVSADMKTLLQDVSPSVNAQLILDGSASGIDLKTFAQGRYSRSGWRALHGLLPGDLVVVYIGRPEARKGFELVLRLWLDHFPQPNFKLVLCGPDSGDVLKRLPAIPSNVLCLGFVNNVPEVLAGSDLLILPSLHEGLSYASMEAQASGALVVANDIIGIRCLIEDGLNGYLVPDNSLNKYVEIIRRINADRSGLEIIKRQARASVARFSRERFLPAYLSFLNGLSSK